MDNAHLMDDSAQRWVVKTARKNFWRVQQWYELDDLIQDGYMWWCFVVNKYHDSAYERCAGSKNIEDSVKQLLMSLFMRTYTNHIHDLSKSRTGAAAEVRLTDLASTSTDEAAIVESALAGVAVCDAYAAVLVNSAPDGVRQVLQAYSYERPSAVSAYRIRGGERETMNDRFCRIAGKDPASTDLVSQVKSYLNSFKDGSIVAT